MPKIAGEFSKPSEPVLVQPKAKTDSVVVAKPAPMAPRAARPAPTPAPVARPASAPQAAAPRPVAVPAQSPDALADKLRSQREAAEKLAEQRVHNAKERPDASRLATSQSPVSSAPAAAPSRQQGGGGSKPKFTFADDDTKSPEAPKRENRAAVPPPGRPSASPLARAGQPPQMAPSRPPLGGERIVAPQVPPPSRQMQPPAGKQPAGFSPQFRPQAPQQAAPQPYRPIDPATGFTPLPPSFNMPPRGPTTANVVTRPMPAPPPASSMDPRLSPPPYMGGDPYATAVAPQRGPMQSPIPRYDQLPPQQQPLRNDQLRPSTQSFEGDYADDIFEDPAPRSPRRASLNDYSQAYHPEQELDYGSPQRRRSSGPIILLSLLFLAALAGIGGVFYYNKFISGGGTASGTGDTPVVATPSQPAKVSPEQTAPDGAVASGQPAQPSKKQIYDRIVGDKEVLGNAQMNSTIEEPVQPAQGQGTAPAAIPMPDAPSTAVAPAAQGGQSGEEPLPLPMPPPVQNNGTQGALPVPAQQQAALPPLVPEPGVASGQTVSPTGYTQDQTQQMAAASQQKTLIEDVPPAAPAAPAAVESNDEASIDATEPVQAKPAAKPKAKAAAPKKKIANSKSLGAKPVVLVPDQNGNDTGLAATQDPPITIDNEPPLQVSPAPVEQPVKKKKTLLGMFTGENKQIDQQTGNDSFDEAVVPPPAPKSKQVASVEPPATAQPLPKVRAVAGNRYILQLASYATQAEAQQAYGKMANNSAVSSLQPTITPVTIGGSTRYRLTLGPVETREQASSACSKLAGVGQPDCVVKRETN